MFIIDGSIRNIFFRTKMQCFLFSTLDCAIALDCAIYNCFSCSKNFNRGLPTIPLPPSKCKTLD